MQKGVEVQGGNTLVMDIVLLRRKLCQNYMWVVKVEVMGQGGTPVGHTYQQKNMYICAPLSLGHRYFNSVLPWGLITSLINRIRNLQSYTWFLLLFSVCLNVNVCTIIMRKDIFDLFILYRLFGVDFSDGYEGIIC